MTDLVQLTDTEPRRLTLQLRSLVDEGLVERVVRGWYANPFAPPTSEQVAMALRPPSYVSMERALSEPGILSQWSFTWTLITRQGPYTYTGAERFEYHQLSARLFFGFTVEAASGVAYARPEKALIDLLYIRWFKTHELNDKQALSLLDDIYLDELNSSILQEDAAAFGPAGRAALKLIDSARIEARQTNFGKGRRDTAGSIGAGESKSEQPVQAVALRQDSLVGANRLDRNGDLVDRDAILERVRQISQRVLGDSGYRLYLFGSFARHEERTSSDIDIAVEFAEPLPLGTLAELREHLEESNIPYHVDVLDLRTADPHFQARVREEGIRWND